MGDSGRSRRGRPSLAPDKSTCDFDAIGTWRLRDISMVNKRKLFEALDILSGAGAKEVHVTRDLYEVLFLECVQRHDGVPLESIVSCKGMLQYRGVEIHRW